MSERKDPGNELLTFRMRLRPITEEDTEAIVELRSNPMGYRFFRVPRQLTREEHLRWFYEKYQLDNSRIDWIALREGQPIGLFNLRREQKVMDCVEVGYLLAPAAQGQGYASEAMEALLQWAIKEWHSKNAFAEIHKENGPSIRFITHMGFDLWKEEPPFVFYWKKL